MINTLYWNHIGVRLNCVKSQDKESVKRKRAPTQWNLARVPLKNKKNKNQRGCHFVRSRARDVLNVVFESHRSSADLLQVHTINNLDKRLRTWLPTARMERYPCFSNSL